MGCPSGELPPTSSSTVSDNCDPGVVCNGGYYSRRRDVSCDRCIGETRRRRANSCTSCASGKYNTPNVDSCTSTTATCYPGYYTRRRSVSCDKCTGNTRRRRAQSCTSCPSGQKDNFEADACILTSQ